MCIAQPPQTDVRQLHGVFIGRFQPFHIGHASVIDLLLDSHTSSTIIIGSAQEADTPTNPRSASTRQEIITQLYHDHITGVTGGRLSIAQLPDYPRDDTRRDALTARIPHPPSDRLVYSGNDWTLDVATAHGCKTHRIDYQIDICATRIRQMIADGDDISDWIPYDKSVLEKT